MKASTFEYRLRYWLYAGVCGLGFWAPWNRLVAIDPPGPNAHVWGLLAVSLSQLGWGVTIATAFNMLLVLGIVFAVFGAFLRTWGGAYLGAEGVREVGVHAAGTSSGAPFEIIEDGPFRFVRNPLYLGMFLHAVALSLLMPRSGAIFTIAAVGGLQIRLILADESVLTKRLGDRYEAYCRLVPRWLPSFRPKVAARGLVPSWGQSLLSEIYFWGVAGSFAFAGWQYNASLLIQCVLVSFGSALVVRAIMPRRAAVEVAV